MNISIQRQEQEDIIVKQLKQTPFRTGKLKWNGRSVAYAIAKDSSRNFRAQVGIRKKAYVFTHLNGKLARIRVYVDNPDRTGVLYSFYYFKDGEMVYKEEPRPNLVNVEEAIV